MHILFETIGYLAEGFVFTYLGFSIMYIKYENCHGYFIVGMGILTAFSRFISLIILPLFFKLFKIKSGI
jgi:NhaP-type Na+/H+ or K+/H+ antiporter